MPLDGPSLRRLEGSHLICLPCAYSGTTAPLAPGVRPTPTAYVYVFCRRPAPSTGRPARPAHGAPSNCPKGHRPTGAPELTSYQWAHYLIVAYLALAVNGRSLVIVPENRHVLPFHFRPPPKRTRQINQLASPFNVQNRTQRPVPTPPLQAPGSTGSLDGEV